jgi:hypothetical protein
MCSKAKTTISQTHKSHSDRPPDLQRRVVKLGWLVARKMRRCTMPNNSDEEPKEKWDRLCIPCQHMIEGHRPHIKLRASVFGKPIDFDNPSPYKLRINSLKKKDGGYVLAGRIPPGTCPYCGNVIWALTNEVPVELESLCCECGGKEFKVSVRSVEMEKGKTDPDWQFKVDIDCKKCKRSKFRENIISFFRLKKIKFGPKGVDIQLK